LSTIPFADIFASELSAAIKDLGNGSPGRRSFRTLLLVDEPRA